MTKLKLRFMIAVVRFMKAQTIHIHGENEAARFLNEISDLIDDLQIKLEEYKND